LPCPDCEANHRRASRAEAAERSLLLFAKTLSRLSKQLSDIEQEIRRRRAQQAPPGAELIPRPRYRIALVRSEDDDATCAAD